MSSNTFFTSDTHFFHTNAITHSNRPFSNVGEMNEALVQKWNSVVKPQDEVYHLGDFSWNGKAQTQAIFDRLRGRKHLVRGNHDSSLVNKLGFETIENYRVLKTQGLYLVLCHFPIHAWDRGHYDSIHLHGHSHGTTENFGLLRFDVGVDCNNYQPIPLEEIISQVPARMEQKGFLQNLRESQRELINIEKERLRNARTNK